MISVKSFEHHHMKMINGWLAWRDAGGVFISDLPKTGFIVPDVACCFLCKTDTNIAFIEGLITNKEKPPGVRKEAAHMVIQSCLDVAKQSGIKTIKFITNKSSVMQYGDDFGFKIQGEYNLYTREI